MLGKSMGKTKRIINVSYIKDPWYIPTNGLLISNRNVMLTKFIRIDKTY